MKILMVDNFDSFTFNLIHYLEPHAQVEIWRNDELLERSVDGFDAVVISPGPGLPKEAGQLIPFLKSGFGNLPLLGVCLGMQAVLEVYGAKLHNLKAVRHGKSDSIQLTEKNGLFQSIKTFEVKVGRYHSWGVLAQDVPNEFVLQAKDEAGYAMAVRHNRLLIHCVQFHPESILTEKGKTMIADWVKTIERS